MDQKLLNAINTYFDAIYHADANLLDQVFHKQSSLFDADQGKIFVDPIASFRQDVATRTSPAERNKHRNDEILLIDFLSKNCAIVKLRLQAHENIFVDNLSFVKDQEQNEWKIVSKVWHLENKVP
ncbi:MAG: nuclear transport factor 2 family protein [Rhizobiales bacterium]|nr:nuclear transport factor 2 family protein [Hyphomicrobiales bacterium]